MVFAGPEANHLPGEWKQSMVGDGVSGSMINRRLAALRSLTWYANTAGLIDWTAAVGNRLIKPPANRRLFLPMPILTWSAAISTGRHGTRP